MNEKIIDRLRKLIRHERSAREIGNVAEAAAFAATIQALLFAKAGLPVGEKCIALRARQAAASSATTRQTARQRRRH